MRTPTLYLDTSVLGGYFDDEFKVATQELWRQMEQGRFRFFTSLVTVDELTEAPERVRELLTTTFAPEYILEVTGEVEQNQRNVRNLWIKPAVLFLILIGVRQFAKNKVASSYPWGKIETWL